MEIIANSPLLRILTYMVTGLAMPVIAWSLTGLMTEMKYLHEAISRQDTTAQLHELRITTLEHVYVNKDAEAKAMSDKLIEHDIRLKNLETKK